MAERKVRDERHKISNKRGNGQLRREVWCNELGAIVRYNLAFINHRIYQGDNGRVLGFDNHHGHHHRHCMGLMEPVEFVTFEELENQFNHEWTMLLQRRQ